jgi:hypothetical protein
MERQTISANSFLNISIEHNLPIEVFMDKYLPLILREIKPELVFSYNKEELVINSTDTLQEYDFELISQKVSEAHTQIIADSGVFEKTFENGQITKTAYILPTTRAEALELLAKINNRFSLDNSFSIGSSEGNIVYPAGYITIYYNGNYSDTGCISYAHKIDSNSLELIDTKLIYSENIPSIAIDFIPSNATNIIYSKFLVNTKYIDIGFMFNTESEYLDYLSSNYASKPAFSALSTSMVTLTLDLTTNTVVRTKRYFL